MTTIFLFIFAVFLTLHKTTGISIPLCFPNEYIMTSLKHLIFLRTADKILKFPFVLPSAKSTYPASDFKGCMVS